MNEHTRASPLSISPNKLLARLPADEYRRLLPHLRITSLRRKQVLLKPQAPTKKIYFLGGGVCSIRRMTADGQAAGVAIAGNEAFIGVNVFREDPESDTTVVVEIAESDAQVMDVERFWREMEDQATFRDLMHRYMHAFIENLMQSVVCNALHPVEKRCARCLLEVRDRVEKNEFPLTHDAVADILGVRRSSITLAAGALQRAGLIDHGRNKRIVIRNPTGLEAASCECYGVIKKHFARLLS